MLKKLLHFDYNSISLPIIAAYMSLAFIFSDFGVSAVIGAGLLCAWTLICFLSFVFVKKFKFRDFKLIQWLIIGFLVVVAINILRNIKFDRDLIYYTIILFMGLALFIMASPVSKKILNITKRILISTASVFSFVNLLYLWFPEFMRDLIYKVISDSSIKYNDRIFWEGYGYAFGSSIGMTACLIALGLMLLWFDFKADKWKIYAPLTVLCAFGLIATQRRGEPLAWFVSIAIVTLVRYLKNKKLNVPKKEQIKAIVIPLICVVIGAVIFFVGAEGSRFGVSEFVIESEEDEELELDINAYSTGRIILWDLAWNSFLEEPVVGHGWRAYAEIGPLSGNPRALDAHNVYLQLLCETGIIGFILIGSYFVTVFVLIVKKIIKTQNQDSLKRYLIGLSVILAMLGFGIIDNSLYINHWNQIFQMMLFTVFLPIKSEDDIK